MRTIAHISDLHFGREERRAVEGLLADLGDRAPSLVVVSGDLTQRARRREFAAARDFLGRLPFPKIVVPGNHDVPLYNVVNRFARPLQRYREYITDELSPTYIDEEIAVLGINTARSLTWKGGRISHRQIAEVRAKLCPVPPSALKIAVTHHQFIPPPGKSAGDLVGRAMLALEALEACGVDLLLAGHLHLGYTGDVRATHRTATRSMVVVQAGTAVSTRGRGEANSYNFLTIDRGHLTVAVRSWDGTRFSTTRTVHYAKSGNEWRRGDAA